LAGLNRQRSGRLHPCLHQHPLFRSTTAPTLSLHHSTNPSFKTQPPPTPGGSVWDVFRVLIPLDTPVGSQCQRSRRQCCDGQQDLGEVWRPPAQGRRHVLRVRVQADTAVEGGACRYGGWLGGQRLDKLEEAAAYRPTRACAHPHPPPRTSPRQPHSTGPRTLCNACGMRYQRSQGKGIALIQKCVECGTTKVR